MLVGTGSGQPGLAAVVARLVGGLPWDIARTDDGAGGLKQLAPRRIYGAAGTRGGLPLADGATLTLGVDAAGRPVTLEAQTLSVGQTASLTLRLVNDRLMFAGGALGRRSLPDVRAASIAPFRLVDPIAYQIALTQWSARTIGRYDSILGSGSADWYLGPDYVTQLEQVLTKANGGRSDATILPSSTPAETLIQSAGAVDVRALVAVPRRAGSDTADPDQHGEHGR